MQLRFPSLKPPCRADRLWEHTCFEAFVGAHGRSDYYEFNVAPSREWAVYAFRDYRNGGSFDETLKPGITVHQADGKLEVEAVLQLGFLKSIEPRAALRLALSAVIEDQSGALSYWALKHPPGKPDFHHPESFALELTPAGAGIVSDPARQR